MSYQEVLSRSSVAISISESADMAVLGLSDDHLRDAMVEVSRHLLALGARLCYGGDLRLEGFSELLFELVARHRRDIDENGTGVTSYLAWPVHCMLSNTQLKKMSDDLAGIAELVLLTTDGIPISKDGQRQPAAKRPTKREWSIGLTSMRLRMLAETDTRIVMGGRVDKYKGRMPGIAEEALLSLQNRQPIFLLGGFGGCARDVADLIGLKQSRWVPDCTWFGRDEFVDFSWNDLNNGLTLEENKALAATPHVDQAVTLIIRGMININGLK